MTPEEARELLEGFLTEPAQDAEEQRRVAIEMQAAYVYAKPETEQQRALSARHVQLEEAEPTPANLKELAHVVAQIREEARRIVEENIKQHGSPWGKLPANA